MIGLVSSYSATQESEIIDPQSDLKISILMDSFQHLLSEAEEAASSFAVEWKVFRRQNLVGNQFFSLKSCFRTKKLVSNNRRRRRRRYQRQ